MDELLIEEKKYVSSKRAAKITGYAKDYIGQLCREGRVPARLVGRGWYVLETAIKDHRFGATDPELKKKAFDTAPEQTIPSTWEPPRYEPSAEDFLPPINRLRTAPGSVEGSTEELNKASVHMQDAWKAWFDRVGEMDTTAPAIEKQEITQEAEEKPIEEKEVNIPIHTLYEIKPEEPALPRETPPVTTERPSEPEAQQAGYVNQRGKKVLVRGIQVFSILFATIMVAIAIAGSGYVDEYIISNSQARMISGIGVYNK